MHFWIIFDFRVSKLYFTKLYFTKVQEKAFFFQEVGIYDRHCLTINTKRRPMVGANATFASFAPRVPCLSTSTSVSCAACTSDAISWPRPYLATCAFITAVKEILPLVWPPALVDQRLAIRGAWSFIQRLWFTDGSPIRFAITKLASVLVVKSQSFCIFGAVIKILIGATRRMFPRAIIRIAERYALDWRDAFLTVSHSRRPFFTRAFVCTFAATNQCASARFAIWATATIITTIKVSVCLFTTIINHPGSSWTPQRVLVGANWLVVLPTNAASTPAF